MSVWPLVVKHIVRQPSITTPELIELTKADPMAVRRALSRLEAEGLVRVANPNRERNVATIWNWRG